MYRVIHRSMISDAIEQEKRSLLKEILEVLEAQRMKTPSPWPFKEKQKPDSEALSEIKTSLAALEEAHMLHKPRLISANEKIKNTDIARVYKLDESIRSLRERLGTEEIIELVIDQPNPAGETPLHISTSLNDVEATRQLLDHGANPNVQDSAGNSPLHTICSERDIQTATSSRSWP